MDGDTPVFAMSVLVLTDTVGSEPCAGRAQSSCSSVVFECDGDDLVVTGDLAEPASSGPGSDNVCEPPLS